MDAGTLLRHRLNNALHATLLLGGLTALLAVVGWVLGGAGGLVWTALVGAFALVLTPRVSPQLVLRMYRARPLSQPEAPALYERVQALAARAGLTRAPVLYYVATPLMNAFSVGRREEAVIAVTDGLLRGLPPQELNAVLAHELAHIAHNDMWIMALADAVSRIVRGLSFLGQFLVLVNLPMQLMQGVAMPWLPLVLLVAAPSLGALLQLALSRNREFDADVEAARITGDPLALAEALRKLEQHEESLLRRIFWPGYRNRQPSLLRTHPVSEARIERLRALAPQGASAAQRAPGEAWGAGPTVLSPGWEPVTAPPRRRWHGTWY